jgi:hypothetical protein
MKNMYEVLDDFEKLQTDKERVDFLIKNRTGALECILRGAYHPLVQYSIKRIPFYKPGLDIPQGMSYSNIALELRKVYLFEENNPKTPKGLTSERKEQLLIQILETLESREAIVFMNMLLKKKLARGLTSRIIKEAMPGVLP